MGGHLVFDAGPDFVGIDKRQCGPVSFRPTTEQQALFVVQGVDSLRVGMLVEAVFEVTAIDGLESFANPLGRQGIFQPDNGGEPLT